MPKAAKERPKHAASLSTQILTDKSPYAAESERSKRKRKAADNEDVSEGQVISGKLSQQILTMAREQLNEDEEEDLSEHEDEMAWRGPQTYTRNTYRFFAEAYSAGVKGWTILRMSGRTKKTTRNMMLKTLRYLHR
jgi:hypothetical protein